MSGPRWMAAGEAIEHGPYFHLDMALQRGPEVGLPGKLDEKTRWMKAVGSGSYEAVNLWPGERVFGPIPRDPEVCVEVTEEDLRIREMLDQEAENA